MTNETSSRTHGFQNHEDIHYRFCPVCGHALETQVIKSLEPERSVCRRCGYVVYPNPKVAVGTLGTLDGKIILLKRGIEPAYGRWVFPGGYVDRGETVEAAGIRETKEEVNLDVKIESLLNVYSYQGRPVIVIVYAVRVIGGDLRAGDETIDVGTFGPEEIPWQELAFPSTGDALREYINRYLPSEL